MHGWELLGLLIFGHALADYPLQGQFLATAKNHTAPLPGVPWYQALLMHSIIHAGFVGLITQSLWLGLAELVVHAATDYAKCAGKISFNQDQVIHILCKGVWVLVLFQL